jgi:hypothetical protein
MLEFLKGNASDRKLRLLAVSFARRAVHLCGSKRAAEALDVAEGVADGQLPRAKRGAALRWLKGTWSQPVSEALVASAHRAALYSGGLAANSLARQASAGSDPVAEQHYQRERERECATQSMIIREIFGNPFHPVTISPSWLTSTVVALAEGIYQEKAFDRMPILADALQDSGCDNAEILDHCCGPGPHVRGCWVVDLLLGKG